MTEERPRREPLGKKLRTYIMERDGYSCRYCGKVGTARDLNVDHVLPVAKGGTNVYANLVTACFACNIQKGAYGGGWLIEQAPEDIREWWKVFLANPPKGPALPKKKRRVACPAPRLRNRVSAICCNLRRLRESRDLTIDTVARRTGLTAVTLYRLESNTAAGFDMATAVALCKYFKCGMGDLFETWPEESNAT